MQAWREEVDDGPWLLSNADLETEARKFHPSFYREIARALIEMDRVVKVACYCGGNGIELSKEKP